jgi:hypothetical protein
MKTAILTPTQDYHCSITANISPADAFEKISCVNEWWAQNFEGSAKNLDDVFTVRFGTTSVTFKITEAVQAKKVAWHVIDCYLPWLNNKTEWTDTTVVFEVSGQGNSTTIDMTHIGLSPEVECYTACEKGWDGHIKESLFKLMTEGQGMPQKG